MTTFSRGAFCPRVQFDKLNVPYPPVHYNSFGDDVGYPPGYTSTVGYAVAIGSGASATTNGTVALGAGSYAVFTEAVAVGGDDTSTSSNAANATEIATIAIGNNSLANDPYNIAIGMNAVSTDSSNLGGTIAIGAGALANNTESIAIGGGQDATNASTASGLRSIAIGTYAVASGQNAIAIGSGTNTQTTTATTGAIAIGTDSNAASSSLAIGGGGGATPTEANGSFSVSVSGQNRSNGTGVTSIGYIMTLLSPNYIVAVGSRCQIDAYGGIAIGGGSASGVNTSIITSTSYYGVAIGQAARATAGPGSGAVALGAAAYAGGSRSIAIGGDPTANSGTTTGIVLANEYGGVVQNGRSFAIAIGGRCKSSVGNQATALGYQTRASNTSAFSIGPGVSNSVATSIALGSTSELVKFHLASTGGFHQRLVKNTDSTTTPTLTTTHVLGQYFTLTNTGAVTVTLPSSTDFDNDSQLAGNLYVGLSFSLILGAGSGTTTIAITLGAGQIAYGLTTAGGAGESRNLMFYRTGTATYDVFIQ